MKTTKHLLGLAITTAMLTACGGSSSSSDKAPDTGTPDQVIPDVVPEEITLTDEQKLALGKQLVIRLDKQSKDLVVGGSQVLKQLMTISDSNNDEELDSEEAELLLIQGLLVLSNSFDDLDDQLPSLYEKVAANILVHNSEEDVEFNTGGDAYNGTVKVTIEEGSPIFTFNLSVEPREEYSDLTIPGELTVTLAQSSQEISDNGEDPANWQSETKLDASFVGESNGVKTSLTNLILKQAYELDDENLAKALSGDIYDYVAIKSASLELDKITVEQESISVSAAVDITMLKPLVTLESGSVGYEETYGSVEALNNSNAENVVGELDWYVSNISSLVGMFTQADDFSVESLNLKQFKVTDLSASIGGAAADNAVLGNLSFEDLDAELYDSGIKLDRMYAKSLAMGPEEEEGTTFTGVSSFLLENEGKQLTLTNDYGSVVYRIAPSEQEIGKFSLTCDYDAKSPMLQDYIGFYTNNYMYNQSRCDENQESTIDMSTIKEWLVWLEDNWLVSMELPGFDRRLNISNLETLTSDSAETSGELNVIGRDEVSANHVNNPLTFSYNLAGSIQLPDLSEQKLSLKIDHPEALDYRITAAMGENNEAINIEFGQWNETLSFSSRVVFSETSFDSVAMINLADVSELVSEFDFNETHQEALAEDGVVENSVGDITVDGLKVADILLYRGNIKDSDADNKYKETMKSSRPEGFAFGIRFTDGNTAENTALFSSMTLISNVDEFSYTESCPVAPLLLEEPEECTRTYYPAIGVLHNIEEILGTLIDENLAPYSIEDTRYWNFLAD